MSKKKKKFKIKPRKVDFTNLPKENMKEELLKLLRIINVYYPTQKQLDLVSKKAIKTGGTTCCEMIELLTENEGRDRDLAFLGLLQMNNTETEEYLREILNSEDSGIEARMSALCILYSQNKLVSFDDYKLILEDGKSLQDRLSQWIKSLENKSSEELEKEFNELPVVQKFLILYYVFKNKAIINCSLINMLGNSKIPKIKFDVATMAENIQSPEVTSILIKLREDKDADVRDAAKRTINVLKNQGLDFFEDIRELPLHCCYITKDIRELGVGTVLIARRFKEHYINYALFLVDTWGMGLKDVFGEKRCHRLKFDKEILIKFKSNPYGPTIEEDISFARKLILGGIAYARQNGFKIPVEFLKWKELVGKLSEDEKDYKGLFGKDGVPFVVASPDDLKRRIVWEDNKEEYFNENQPVADSHSFDEILNKLESRGVKFLTSLNDDIPDDVLEMADPEMEEDIEAMKELEELEQIHEEMDAAEIVETEEFNDEVLKEIDMEKIENPVSEFCKEEVREEVKEEVREEVKEEVREEVKEEVREEAKEEVREEAKEEVREEVRKEIKEEVREEVKRDGFTKKEYYKSSTEQFQNKKYQYKRRFEEKKIDFDLEMEDMYDELEELIYQEEEDRAYRHFMRMLRKAAGTSWEEDILKDVINFCLESYNYDNKCMEYCNKLENFYKRKNEDLLLLETRMDKADILGTMGKIEEGLEIYNSILKDSPNFHRAMLKLAGFYLNNDMLNKGVATYKKLIELRDKVDEQLLGEAILEFIYVINEHKLEKEDPNYYRKIAAERNILLIEEPEVIVNG